MTKEIKVVEDIKKAKAPVPEDLKKVLPKPLPPKKEKKEEKEEPKVETTSDDSKPSVD